MKANFDLTKWAQAAHVPSFEEYMEVSEVDVAVYASMAGIFMCLGNTGTKKAFEWLKTRPKLVKSVSTKARLMNDIFGFEVKILIYFISSCLISCVHLTKLHKH